MFLRQKKLSLGLPTKYGSNKPAQLQRLVITLKFCMSKFDYSIFQMVKTKSLIILLFAVPVIVIYQILFKHIKSNCNKVRFSRVEAGIIAFLTCHFLGGKRQLLHRTGVGPCSMEQFLFSSTRVVLNYWCTVLHKY